MMGQEWEVGKHKEQQPCPAWLKLSYNIPECTVALFTELISNSNGSEGYLIFCFIPQRVYLVSQVLTEGRRDEGLHNCNVCQNIYISPTYVKTLDTPDTYVASVSALLPEEKGSGIWYTSFRMYERTYEPDLKYR
ncbi:hypothetical protein MPTK1_8g03060 [Marchantia polymorpha subsp. ruderalis]|uniref:Uncharacterized protein n=1 Tax=Marchantia polymorpha TaxID=3197 RepID=A0A2R6XJ97_MARPO|nr:hypothetical protein MARPO_0012s0099 [Marchantia polymorpha]PTQ46152.1 hypothetical protein MARPO_0012s0099 [Marchantia polymorpha]BBN18507.1 hypothetical protein Mp_8g03060 [Marchantia polymorpha subsp. ruderalis]BBN18508.1 hypothetical protein Mp_8g03060 [Marchantia polymorpha subsp. ruderalis]|eukprot:PTQ46151.1 hypothetical protein MARPO_0012s0099 [Marchantia polymorpha]